LKELGVDPATSRPLILKDGRFGMYVTDGETNATLRRGDTVEAMTLERGLELLAGRRAWEIENGGVTPKKSKRLRKNPSTLTKNIVKRSSKRSKNKKLEKLAK
jgi:DNA topoisomerase-1